jgi:hypothetical protein
MDKEFHAFLPLKQDVRKFVSWTVERIEQALLANFDAAIDAVRRLMSV